ncbi:MAG: septum formation initiator family protein [Bacilli bacterium]|nr:septum formation initiator family protein [Bacilli bacterium]
MNKREQRIYSIRSEYMEQYERQQKRNQRRKRSLIQRLVIAGVLMLATVAYMVHYHLEQRSVYSEKLKEYEALQSEMSELKKTEEELKEEIKLLNDEDYILEIARTNYFLTKEGELIFLLDDADSSY